MPRKESHILSTAKTVKRARVCDGELRITYYFSGTQYPCSDDCTRTSQFDQSDTEEDGKESCGIQSEENLLKVQCEVKSFVAVLNNRTEGSVHFGRTAILKPHLEIHVDQFWTGVGVTALRYGMGSRLTFTITNQDFTALLNLKKSTEGFTKIK